MKRWEDEICPICGRTMSEHHGGLKKRHELIRRKIEELLLQHPEISEEE